MAVTLETLELRLIANQKELVAGLNKAQTKVDSFSAKSQKSFGLLKTAFAAIFASQALRSVVNAADSMQRLEFRLNATTGSATAAAEAMSFLRDTAKKQSVDIIDLADGYTRLLPSVKSNIISMADMRQILTLANDNIKAFGLSTSETQGLFLGLSQALGSGTVTMEDLRQVTDRLPGSLNAIAKASNMSVNEFKKLIATGSITADMIKGPLITAFKANEGAAASMSNSFSSAKTQLNNTLKELSKGSGIIDVATTATLGLNSAVEGLNSFIEANQELGKFWADTFNPAIRFFDLMERQKNLNIDWINQQKKIEKQQKAANLLGFETYHQMKAVGDELQRQVDLNNKLLMQGPLEAQGPPAPNNLKGIPTPVLKPQDEAKAALDELNKLNEDKLALQKEWDDAALKLGQDTEDARKQLIFDSQDEITNKTTVFLDRLALLDRLNGEAKVKATVFAFKDVLSEAAKHNKALFELNKIAGISSAVISTAEGIAKAWSLGPILGPIGAAAVAAAGAAQIATISSQSFGGGGGNVSSGAGGGTSSAVVPAPAPAIQQNVQDVNISVTGGGQIDAFALIAAINEAQGDGATLIRNVRIA